MSTHTIARTYADETIEHWGRYYTAHPRLRERGVTFAAFLARPRHYVETLVTGTPGLLPRQIAVQARVDAFVERERLSVRNGAIVEPLHHTQRGRHYDRSPRGER